MSAPITWARSFDEVPYPPIGRRLVVSRRHEHRRRRQNNELGPIGADFLRCLPALYRRHKRPDLHVVLDNSSTHPDNSGAVRAGGHPTVHSHFTPTGASWLNMVEAWFSILTPRSVRRGSFDTVRALARPIRNSLEHWDDNRTAFLRTRDPAAIMKKVFCRPC
jgi:transposase